MNHDRMTGRYSVSLTFFARRERGCGETFFIFQVRLPINEDCWLGINGVSKTQGGPAYQTKYKQVASLLTSHGIAVLADLHWTALGSSLAKGQGQLPDRDHAPTMWAQVAAAFKGNPLVLFELFNEPFPGGGSASTKDWQCWATGSCSGTDVKFQAAGQQELVKAVRSTGATNVILMGGMAWSNDLTHWLDFAPLAADPLQQSAAVWHSYANNACSHKDCWEKTIAKVAAQVPVVVTEMGHGIQWAVGLMEWIEQQHGSISYLPWTWNTWGSDSDARAGGKGEALVSDYSTGEPTDWGKAVKSSFAKATIGTATQLLGTTTPPSSSSSSPASASASASASAGRATDTLLDKYFCGIYYPSAADSAAQGLPPCEVVKAVRHPELKVSSSAHTHTQAGMLSLSCG